MESKNYLKLLYVFLYVALISENIAHQFCDICRRVSVNKRSSELNFMAVLETKIRNSGVLLNLKIVLCVSQFL